MEKPEIIQETPSETQLDTSKGTNISLPFYKTISLLETIFKWQPMGKRVILDLPLIGDDRGFLFLVRCSPWVPYYPDLVHLYPSHRIAGNVLMNFESVVHDSDWGFYAAQPGPLSDDNLRHLVGFTANPGIAIVTHSAPPLISKLAEMYRYWKGGLEFRFRTKAGFTHSANILMMPVVGARVPTICMPFSNTQNINMISPFNFRSPILFKEKFSYLGLQANSFMNMDLSMSRHMEAGWSYNLPFPYVDQFGNVANILNTEVTQLLSWSPNSPCFDNFIGIAMRGTIDNSSTGSNQVEIEIEMRASQDFMFSGENVAFNAASDSDYACFGTTASGSRFGTAITAGNTIVPRKYRNPWLTEAGVPFIQYNEGDETYNATGNYTYD